MRYFRGKYFSGTQELLVLGLILWHHCGLRFLLSAGLRCFLVSFKHYLFVHVSVWTSSSHHDGMPFSGPLFLFPILLPYSVTLQDVAPACGTLLKTLLDGINMFVQYVTGPCECMYFVCVRQCVSRSKSRSGGDGEELLLQLIGPDEKSGRGRTCLSTLLEIIWHPHVCVYSTRLCVKDRREEKNTKAAENRRVMCTHLLLTLLPWWKSWLIYWLTFSQSVPIHY